MHSLVIGVRVKPGKNDEFLRTWTCQILPLFKKQDGFVDVMLLFEEGTTGVASLSFWKTANHREHYHRDVVPQAKGSVAHLINGVPKVRCINAAAAYLSPNLQLLWRDTNDLEQPKRKVFVVDDEKQIADLLGQALRDAEFDVETFYDAKSALIKATDGPPDILVSDIDMPEMNGVALAGTLHKQNSDCKVILISGNPEWKSRADLPGDVLDGFAFLRKPFPLSKLLCLMRRIK